MRIVLLLALVSWVAVGAEPPLADPMAPPAALRAAAPATSPNLAGHKLVLQQVVASPPARVVISGQMLRLGDQIDGWTLISIERRAVVLQGADGTRRLTMFEGGPAVARGE